MSATGESGSTFAYQTALTRGAGSLAAPGLLEIPSLDATLKMHRAYKDHIKEDIDYDWDGNVTHSYTDVEWSPWNEEMSRDVLIASSIASEIDKGLTALGIDWRARAEGSHEEQEDEDLTLRLSCHPPPPGLFATRDVLVEQACEIVRIFQSIGSYWTVEDRHLYAERCVDEREGIYITTMDEWEVDCPDLPSVSGLRNWHVVDEEAEEEGYLFDGSVLVEECKKVLVGIADLILESENSGQG